MRNSTKKLTAWFFLIILGLETFYPGMAYALTSGPSQPEMQKFEPAGVSNLVDLFTGDFKYNIPILDVGGYPVNLAYHSGEGMEDEASWVGSGWSLNPGAITRSMRGLPDDFNGDQVIKEYRRKPLRKIGAQIVLKPSVMAWEFGSASLKYGVYKDNYYGIGAELGASLGFQLGKNKKTSLTAGLDINSDVRQGVSISPSLGVNTFYEEYKDVAFPGLSGGFNYNTRSGLKSFNLSASFATSRQAQQNKMSIDQPSISYTKYFGQSYTPTLRNNSRNYGVTYSFDLGPSVFGGYLGLGGSGYYYTEEIVDQVAKAPAFGYMYHRNGRSNTGALIDYNREKDGVVLRSTPAIAIPVATNDFFMATGQAGSQQFRPWFAGNYMAFDKEYQNNTYNLQYGATVGLGNQFKGGARLEFTAGKAQTGKWVEHNDFLGAGEPTFDATPADEAVYFKKTGEQSGEQPDQPQDQNLYYNLVGQDNTQQVAINDVSRPFSKAKAYAQFKARGGQRTDLSPLKRNRRDPRTSNISFLTAEQAAKYGLDKSFNSSRKNNYRLAHHISEMTVNDNEGKRMVYGIPVYNKEQREVSFSVNGPAPGSAAAEQARRTGLITYNQNDNSRSNRKGRDNLFSREIIPAYATSFLLTGILSSDYVDIKNDGITDDDLGSAIKFNYTQAQDYKWRAPYAANTANYNEGFNSDTKDDKANYVYGVKENWYLQTIESKTMIAVFELSNREDGLGVLGENGGANTAVRLKKLDRIKLYSKAEYIKNPTNATPIKTVYFEYDYSLYPQVPNNTGTPVMVPDPANPTINKNLNAAKGKLTLKKVYFTFGNNTRGISNPYEFEYDVRLVSSGANGQPSDDPLEAGDLYTTRQQDRWGTYKQSWYNYQQNGARALNNSEFPYTLQANDDTPFDEKELNNRFVSKWQLNKITTPTGSVMNVQYEADDYAFVQNRRAMQMCIVKGVGNSLGQSFEGMNNAEGFSIDLPVNVPGGDVQAFLQKYLMGSDGVLMDKLFYKIYTSIDNKNDHYEYIHGYAEINIAGCTVSSDGKTAFIALKKVNGYNPVSKAAWQMLKTDLPQFAYDNYDNSDSESFFDDMKRAVKSMVTAFINLREMFISFDKTARNKKFANKIDLSKSMVRLYAPDAKIGGGSRVKKIEIKDNWQEMTGVGKTAVYGEVYDYKAKDASGNEYSSGVAAYEPQVGNEENPFHEPVNYTEKVHWSSDKYHFIEKPFCETWFPAATVGYSKVTVTSFGDDYAQGATLTAHSGFTVNEFYTARDFPTYVDNLPREQSDYESNLVLKLFASVYVQRLATAQGFKVELNDMHGKQKAVKVYNKGGDEISSVENFYSVEDEHASEKKLYNTVDVLRKNTTDVIEQRLLATDVDMVTDVRESVNESIGGSVAGYIGGMWIAWFFVPYGAVIPNGSYTVDSYHSVSTVKIIHRYGILKKVRTTKNGSSITAENLLWDAETGAVLLTKTQNEFDDYTYAFNYPAYKAENHEGMDAAYKNIGTVFPAFNTGSDGIVPAGYKNYLSPGDELISTDGNQKGWVLKSGDGSYRFIDGAGNFIAAGGTYMVLRSGRRNLTGASVGSIVCMNNPVSESNGVKKLQFSVYNKVLDAKAVLYSDEWGVPVNNKPALVDACIEVKPDRSADGNYLLSSSNVTCNGDFGASFTGSTRESGFLDFGALTQIPAGATILSAKLTLYGREMSGSNTSYLRRITQHKPCSVAAWTNQPVVTATNQVELPATTTTRNFADIDITAMFSDWYTTKDVNIFGIGINKRSALPTLGKMIFYGSNGIHGEFRPELDICYRYTDPCMDPVNRPMNPYTNGVKGNWRPQQNFVYTVNREQKPGLPYLNGSTNIRNSGYYSVFNPFWMSQAGYFHTNVLVDQDIDAERWIRANKSVYFDQKGNEVESMDALKRYGAALYGYRESVATAVGANGRRNEIAFDGFEDYNFSLQNNVAENCPLKRHFDWGLTQSSGSWCSNAGCISTEQSHTGKYSYRISGGSVNVSTPAGNSAPPSSFMGYDNTGRAILLSNELATGFAPVNGKKYLLSMWAYDGMKASNKVNNLTVTINGVDQQVNTKVVPVVEGWKRLELSFTAGSDFSLSLNAGGTIYIDDVRIVPFDGQINTYVYDDLNLRLMAQLDENNFATFYEYDDEGTLIRVKKETERGIMTLKESRQSFRQR